MNDAPDDADDADEWLAEAADPAARADRRFLDALLVRLHQPAEIPRVAATLAGLRAPPLAARGLRWRRAWIASTVAAVALAVLVMAPWPAPAVQAAEFARRVAEAAELAGDRHYRVAVAWPDGRRQDADLWVNGADRFALRHPALRPGLRGQDLWLGSDAGEAWFVPAAGPVVTLPDFDRLHRFLERRQTADLPLLSIPRLARRLTTHYDLAPPVRNGRGGVEIRGTLRGAGEGWLPATVEIVGDERTGGILRLRAAWAAPRGVAMTCEFAGAGTPEAGWYGHAAHHRPERPVLGAPEEQP